MFSKVQEVRPNSIIFCVIFCQIISCLSKKHRNVEQKLRRIGFVTFGTLCEVSLIGHGHAAIQLHYETKLANTEQLIKKHRNMA